MFLKFLLSFAILLIFSNQIFSQEWKLEQVLSGSGVTDIAAQSDGTVFITTSSWNYPNGSSAGVFRKLAGSDNYVSVGPDNNTTFAFIYRTVHIDQADKVWISGWINPFTQEETLYMSETGNPGTWQVMYTAGASNNIFAIDSDSSTARGENIYLGTREGFLTSNDGGLNFNISSEGLPSDTWTKHIQIGIPSNRIFISTTKLLYKSLDYGDSWTSMEAGNNDTSASIGWDVKNERFAAGTFSGLSSNLLYYEEPYEKPTLQLSLSFSGGELSGYISKNNSRNNNNSTILSGYSRYTGNLGGVIRSDDETNYYDYSLGISVTDKFKISALYSDRYDNLYAGTFLNTNLGAKIYSRSYTVGLNNISTGIPDNYLLKQNYPNPFNPETNIEFSVRERSIVKLTVFNSLGKQIEELVNEEIDPGKYQTNFNAHGITSGIYFYRLEAGNYSETKRMVLIK